MQLKQIDQLEIVTLEDNYIDRVASTNDGNGIIHRADNVRDSIFLKSVLAEHGFSCLVTLKDSDETHRVLFDFGCTDFVAAYNAEILGESLSDVEIMVLSHGHSDHFGGLGSLVKKINRKGIELHLHPAAFRNDRYLKNRDEQLKASPLLRADVETLGVHIDESVNPKLLMNDTLLLLGEIPRKVEFEKGNPGFYYQENGREKTDRIEDDTAVVAHVKNKGLVVITGCAHSGIINTTTYAMEVTGIDRLCVVFGGFHLTGPEYEDRIEPTIAALKELNPEYIVPTHCTGYRALVRMEQEISDKVLLNMSGTTMTFHSGKYKQ
jgi:7,8-dihydropterin-6-yl-methyl-4-(beta-D-ribofuranosyl)aminobenzene 5'-phosphate synthase